MSQQTVGFRKYAPHVSTVVALHDARARRAATLVVRDKAGDPSARPRSVGNSPMSSSRGTGPDNWPVSVMGSSPSLGTASPSTPAPISDSDQRVRTAVLTMSAKRPGTSIWVAILVISRGWPQWRLARQTFRAVKANLALVRNGQPGDGTHKRGGGWPCCCPNKNLFNCRKTSGPQA